jgi:hypothetical protein
MARSGRTSSYAGNSDNAAGIQTLLSGDKEGEQVLQMISDHDSLPGMCYVRDAHPVNQPDRVMFANRPAYAATITVLRLHRTFLVSPVIADRTEITALQTLPATITRRMINVCNIFALPHQLSELHCHLEPVRHAVSVTVTQGSNERRIECPETMSLSFDIKLSDKRFRFF